MSPETPVWIWVFFRAEVSGLGNLGLGVSRVRVEGRGFLHSVNCPSNGSGLCLTHHFGFQMGF